MAMRAGLVALAGLCLTMVAWGQTGSGGATPPGTGSTPSDVPLPGSTPPPAPKLEPGTPLPGQSVLPGVAPSSSATDKINAGMAIPPAAGAPPTGAPGAAGGGGAPVAPTDPNNMNIEQIVLQAKEIVGEILKGVNVQQMQQLSREAMDRLNFVLTRDPRNIEAMLLSGELLIAMNQFDNARNYFKLVMDIEPQNFRANFGTGKIWCANRFFRHAIRFLETAEQVAPATEQANVKRYLAEAYRGVGENQKGIAKAEESVRAARDAGADISEPMLLLLDIRRTDTLQFDKAVEDADQLVQYATQQLKKDPSDVRSLQLMERYLAISVETLRQYHNLFYIKSATNQITDQLIPGKEKDAAAVLTKMAGRMEGLAQTRQTLGMYEVMVLMDKATRYDPSNVAALEQYVDALIAMKMVSKAAEACQQILSINPTHDGAKRFLATFEGGAVGGGSTSGSAPPPADSASPGASSSPPSAPPATPGDSLTLPPATPSTPPSSPPPASMSPPSAPPVSAAPPSAPPASESPAPSSPAPAAPAAPPPTSPGSDLPKVP